MINRITKFLDSNTKEKRRLINNYNFALQDSYINSDIYKVYDRPSSDKVKAFNECVEDKEKANGKNGVIVTHNTFVFSYAYTCYVNNIKHIIYITPIYQYVIPC